MSFGRYGEERQNVSTYSCAMEPFERGWRYAMLHKCIEPTFTRMLDHRQIFADQNAATYDFNNKNKQSHL